MPPSIKTAATSQFPLSIQNLLQFMTQSGVVEKIVLFGSRATGSHRENSDYDFCIWVRDHVQWPALKASLEEKNLTLLPIDLALYDELSLAYKKSIDREGVLVYG